MRIGATVGNVVVMVAWGAVGFVVFFGGVELLAQASVPVLSPAAKAFVSGFHYAAQAV